MADIVKGLPQQAKEGFGYARATRIHEKTIPEATLGFIKKRIDNIRSCFRRELAKVQASKTSGAGTENVYTPKLWYFELLEFTIVHELPKASKSSLPSASTDVNEDMEPQEEDDTEDQIFDAPESEVSVTIYAIFI